MDLIELAAISFLIMTIFTVYLLIKVPKGYALKYLAIPLMIMMGLQFVMTLPQVLGRPKLGYPEANFKLVGYKMDFVDHKLVIQAWVKEADQSKLYQFPFSEEVAAQLAKMAAHGGQGKFEKKGGGKGTGQGDSETLSEIDIPHENLPSKDQSPTL
jgi:hypothetical protein